MRRLLDSELVKMLEDRNRIVLYGGVGTFDKCKKVYPDRVINMGCREQAMIGVSAGLAIAGFKPIVYTITPFLIERCLEQIKLDINQMNLPVTLIGFADYPHDGITHQEMNTELIMGMFNNIRSHYPKTKDDFYKALYDEYLPKFIKLHNV